MKSMNENKFHWLMGALLLGSCFLDPLMLQVLTTWDPPQPSFATTVIGLIWVGRYSAWRLELAEESRRVLSSRIEQLEHRSTAVEDELRRKNDPFSQS